MSLDVYLNKPNTQQSQGSGIFIRDGGATREITREEWDRLNPGREPIIVADSDEGDQVFWRNITHNLNGMAAHAGIYQACWRPEEIGVSKASQLVPLLRDGLAKLEADPERFRQYDSPNGWGRYEHLVEFVRAYLSACEEHPDADVRVSR